MDRLGSGNAATSGGGVMLLEGCQIIVMASLGMLGDTFYTIESNQLPCGVHAPNSAVLELPAFAGLCCFL